MPVTQQHTVEETPCMSAGDIQVYAKTRLFGENIDEESITGIIQHNGTLPSALERELNDEHGDRITLVEQANRREPIYHTPDGKLHIPQYSGFGRAFRYRTMIAAYNATLERPIPHIEVDLEGDPRKTSLAYDNYAYDFVKRIFHGENREQTERSQTAIIGPIDAARDSVRTIATLTDEYISAQLIDIDGSIALNIGYLYADQAGILLEKLLREREAAAKAHGRGENIAVYMFGRVGSLETKMRRDSLIFPTGVIDEIDLRRGTPFVYPLHNILAPDEPALNLNTRSVVLETRELLATARGYGCVCTEMEAREAAESINRARRRYTGTLTVSFGFAGHVSDRPLVPGDTLANELESDAGEERAVRAILEHARNHPTEEHA